MSRILDNKRSKDPKRIKHLSENSKKFRLENPEKYKAELLVNNILRRKYLRLIKPRVSFVSGL